MYVMKVIKTYIPCTAYRCYVIGKVIKKIVRIKKPILELITK